MKECMKRLYVTITKINYKKHILSFETDIEEDIIKKDIEYDPKEWDSGPNSVLHRAAHAKRVTITVNLDDWPVEKLVSIEVIEEDSLFKNAEAEAKPE
jgi:hypothetical protein